MGLIILIVVGAILGWLATIVLRIEDTRGVLLNIGTGILGAVAVGLFVSGGTIFAGIGATSLLWAMLGSAVSIAALNFVRRRQSYN